MKTTLIGIAFLLVQIMAHQDRAVVHLLPNATRIDASFGGKQLDLINAPAELSLPSIPPRPDTQGNAWIIDVKNLGPNSVTVLWSSQFRVSIHAGQTIHLMSSGILYTVKY